jgi:hypothetical protein
LAREGFVRDNFFVPFSRIAETRIREAMAQGEVELLNEVSRLEHAIAETADAAAKQQLRRALVYRQTQLAIALERK